MLHIAIAIAVAVADDTDDVWMDGRDDHSDGSDVGGLVGGGYADDYVF